MNVSFEYLYRDGANYKNWGEVVLTTTSSVELSEIDNQIRRVLIDGEYFVAEQANLPTLYFADRDITVDHWWHEYSGVSWTERGPTLAGTIEDLVKRLAEPTRINQSASLRIPHSRKC